MDTDYVNSCALKGTIGEILNSINGLGSRDTTTDDRNVRIIETNIEL